MLLAGRVNQLLILAKTLLSVQVAPLSSGFPRSKALKRLSIDGKANARPLRSPLCPLRDRFARFRLRHWAGGDPRRRATPGASLESLPHKLEDGSPILRNHLHPRHFSHHGEIDPAETKPC